MGNHHAGGISRRGILRLAGTFGWTTTLLAAGATTGPLTLARLATAAETTRKRRYAKRPAVTLTHGTGMKPGPGFLINLYGIPEFIRDLEERTDGEIRVELIPGGVACKSTDCVSRARQGIVDLFSSSTQNAAGAAHYYNILDFPYLFPGRAAQYHFLYHRQSERLLREPLRKHHGIQFLFSSCHLRGLMMGLKWRDRPAVRSVGELAGKKIRVTPSKLGRIALSLLKIAPVIIPWNVTGEALRRGVIDGMETWESAAASTMPQAISQAIDLRLFSGTGHTAMNASVFDRLSAAQQDAVMESAYHMQVFVQLAGEAALVNTVGASDPMKQDTVFARNGIRFVELPEEELKKAERMCSPEFVPGPWETWRKRLNTMAGGIDIYREIHRIAREIPADLLAENVAPRRWWKPAG